MKQKEFAGTILEVPGNRFALQLRDNKPGIANPGLIGIFGGEIEAGESPEQAAKRELEEEISLRGLKVHFQKTYAVVEKNRHGELITKKIHTFSSFAEVDDFEVYEGSLTMISFENVTDSVPFSPGTLQMLRDYICLRDTQMEGGLA